jgi:NADPH:quinone reductase-like Zn-dependent oxidoreductase
MARAVRFDQYGPLDVLDVVEVPRPSPGRGRVLVEVVASAINPGEIMIREGAMAEQAPASFPSGQGSDLAGRVVELGDDVSGWAVGDEVIGWTDERAAQADLVPVPADQLTRRPPGVPWDQAASLYVAGCTACAMVDAVAPQAGETVAVAGAAGGVGSIAVQLLRGHEARVLGIAGPGNDDWLASLGVQPVNYGDGLGERLAAAAPEGIAAVLDAYGGGYVDQAVELGVAPERIVTIADPAAAERHGARTVFGHRVASAAMLAKLASRIDRGQLTIPIAATYPLEQVRDAYARLAERHTRGKIVLRLAD